MITRVSLSLLICAARAVALVGAVLWLTPLANAQPSQNWEWCVDRGLSTVDRRIGACSAIIESGSETPENMARAYGNRGVAYDNKREPDRALHDYDESVRLDPTSAFGHRMLGNAYKLKKDYDHAIAEYDEAIRLNPDDAFPRSNRGALFHEKKEYDRAIAELSEAIRRDPTFTTSLYGRGLSHLAKRDTPQAIADFDEVIRQEPKYAVAYADRGIAYAQRKEYDRAIADYNDALSMELPERVRAATLSNLCWARFVINRDPQDTLGDCTKALNLRPDDAWALNTRGFTYLKLGEISRSIADFNAAVTLNSKMAISWYGRGLAKRRAGDQQAGDKDIEMAKMIRPDIVDGAAVYDVH